MQPPEQTDELFPALATGDWLTVTITGGDVDDPHPDPAGHPVPVTIAWKYSVEVNGSVFSVGLVAPGMLNQLIALVETSHWIVPAPCPVSVMTEDCPEQIAVGTATGTPAFGGGPTARLTVSSLEVMVKHPPEAVTVYVMLVESVQIGLAMFGLLKPTVGAQLYWTTAPGQPPATEGSNWKMSPGQPEYCGLPVASNSLVVLRIAVGGSPGVVNVKEPDHGPAEELPSTNSRTRQ